jgi:hypothetical protein
MPYVATLGGQEFEAYPTVTPGVVDLYWDGDRPPASGFEVESPGVYVKHALKSELDSLYNVKLYCDYRGEPFKVNDDRGETLSLYYLGGDINKARELGLSIEEPLVATIVVSRDEVENLREERTQLWPPVDGPG